MQPNNNENGSEEHAKAPSKPVANEGGDKVNSLESPVLNGTTPPTENEVNAAGSNGSTTDWLDILANATCSAEELECLNIPEREPILGAWFKQGDLGFIFGPRGLGKTWLAMHLARTCAEGGKLADWQTHKARRVLYVDGEMPLDAMRERDEALRGAKVDGMFYLQHEVLFHAAGKVLNLTSPCVQKALLQHCLSHQIEILFLDNLSCLFSGVSENDANAWELVLPWLLTLRRNRIAVVFVAHAGRNGFMRGTSRREDAAFWLLQLSESPHAGQGQDGAKFVSRFVKNRNSTAAACPPLSWHFFKPNGDKRAQVSWATLSTLQVLRQKVEDGLNTASDIAAAMGLSKGQVSKLARKALDEGWLTKNGRAYALASQN